MKKQDWPEYATWWEKNEGKVILVVLFIEAVLIAIPIFFRVFLLENLQWALIWMGILLFNSILLPMIMPREHIK